MSIGNVHLRTDARKHSNRIDAAARPLERTELDALVEFFQLLDLWDREEASREPDTQR